INDRCGSRPEGAPGAISSPQFPQLQPQEPEMSDEQIVACPPVASQRFALTGKQRLKSRDNKLLPGQRQHQRAGLAGLAEQASGPAQQLPQGLHLMEEIRGLRGSCQLSLWLIEVRARVAPDAQDLSRSGDAGEQGPLCLEAFLDCKILHL